MNNRAQLCGLDPGPDFSAELSRQIKLDTAREELHLRLKERIAAETLEALKPTRPKPAPERPDFQFPPVPPRRSDCGI